MIRLVILSYMAGPQAPLTLESQSATVDVLPSWPFIVAAAHAPSTAISQSELWGFQPPAFNRLCKAAVTPFPSCAARRRHTLWRRLRHRYLPEPPATKKHILRLRLSTVSRCPSPLRSPGRTCCDQCSSDSVSVARAESNFLRIGDRGPAPWSGGWCSQIEQASHLRECDIVRSGSCDLARLSIGPSIMNSRCTIALPIDRHWQEGASPTRFQSAVAVGGVLHPASYDTGKNGGDCVNQD